MTRQPRADHGAAYILGKLAGILASFGVVLLVLLSCALPIVVLLALIKWLLM